MGQEAPKPALKIESANGENPVWCLRSRRLYWIDVEQRFLHRFNPDDGKDEQWEMPEQIGALALCLSGHVLLALRSGLILFGPDTGERRWVASAPFDPELYRFNDGKCDALGRFWVGTKHEPRSGSGGGGEKQTAQPLWRFDRHGALEATAATAVIANGIAWSPDHRSLYFTDTNERRIRRYEFDLGEGTIGAELEFVTLAEGEGRPDGAAVDSEGNYWVAAFGGSKILKFAPDGLVEEGIAMPVSQPTMCAFGGDDLRTLYITTARSGLDSEALAQEPLAGSVFCCRPGAMGLAPNLFGDSYLLRAAD